MAKSNLLVLDGGKGIWGFTWAAFSGDPSEIINAFQELLFLKQHRLDRQIG